MYNPLVSIIIPVYNSAKYLAETIQSVIDQTWQNKELIIVDDGSTDNSIAIAKQFNFTWISIITQRNSGAPAARNLGIRHAKGDFIQFLDADDILGSNKIELQTKALQGHQDQLSVCSTIHFNNGENYLNNHPSPYEEEFLFSTGDVVDFLINLWGGNNNRGSMIQTNAWLVPKSLISQAGPWQEFYSPDDDGEYFSRIILVSKGIIYTKNCFNYYRKTQNGLANRDNYNALLGCYKSALLKQKYLFRHIQTEKAKFAIARQLISLAIESYPKYPTLTKKITSDIKKLGQYTYAPIGGGPITRKLSIVLGWKFGRLFQYILHKR